MNRGKGLVITRLGGYTIVETLIFLAVSSAVFFSALALVGGQQNKAQFVNAVRDLETRITDISNNIATGYYQNGANFHCINSSGKPTYIEEVNEQGANKDCILVGTVIKFGSSGGNGTYTQFNLAGLRTYTNGTGEHPVASLGVASPRAIYRYDTGALIPDATVKGNLLYGATVGCVGVGSSCVAGPSKPGAIGFFASLTPTGSQGGGISTDLFFYNAVTKNLADSATAPLINNGSPPVNFNYASPPVNAKNPSAGVTICLNSGSTNQYALIHLGGLGTTKLVVTSEIKSGSNCS